MKKSYILLILLSVFGLINKATGQTIFFEEDFENNGIIPTNWKNIYVSSNLNWRYEDGGFSTNPNIPNIGASAAISGVLGAYLVLFPLAKILTIIPIGFFLLNTKLPAYIFLFVWIGMQFLNGVASISAGTINNVAYFAHIGGFLYGFIYTISNRRKFLDRLYFKHKNILF